MSTLIWGKAALAGRKCRPTLSPGGVEGLKSAATSRSLGNRAYVPSCLGCLRLCMQSRAQASCVTAHTGWRVWAHARAYVYEHLCLDIICVFLCVHACAYVVSVIAGSLIT